MSLDLETDPAEVRHACSPVLDVEEFRPLSSTVSVELGVFSDGRPRNAPSDDHYLVVRLGRSQETVMTSLAAIDVPQRFLESAYCMLLADGIGGTDASALASRLAVTTLVHLALHYGHWNVRVDSRSASEIAQRLDWCYGKADEAVKRRARANRYLHGMATRVTAVYTAGDDLFVAYSGRSLAYVYRDGRLHHLSANDPSRLKGRHPRLPATETRELSSILTDAIGGTGKLVVTVKRYQMMDGDTLMLSTEGLNASLSEDQIADALADRRRPEDLCRRLVAAALDAHSNENVTVLLAQYRIPGRVP
jgi:serine/threonine protein phosphatase PrpC